MKNFVSLILGLLIVMSAFANFAGAETQAIESESSSECEEGWRCINDYEAMYYNKDCTIPEHMKCEVGLLCQDGACIKVDCSLHKISIEEVLNKEGKIAVIYKTVGAADNVKAELIVATQATPSYGGGGGSATSNVIGTETSAGGGGSGGVEIISCPIKSGSCGAGSGSDVVTCTVYTECDYPEFKQNTDYWIKIIDEKCSNIYDTLGIKSIPKCTDSDDGLNYYVKGRTGRTAGGPYFDEDYCQKGGDITDPSRAYYASSCRGDDCYLIEMYCLNNDNAFEVYTCPNGCKDGACIKEETVCEICIGGIDTGKVDENGCPIYECPTEPIGKYVNLNEKFSLIQDQSAKVKDHGYMKITLTNWMCTGACPSNTPCEVSCAVMLQVEMPSDCVRECNVETGVCSECAVTGTNLILSEGESKEVFGAKITYLAKQGKEGIFIVEKPIIIREGVDIEIYPTEQTITYEGKANYKVTVTDKHPMAACIPEIACEQPVYTYLIDVRNLPFLKEYPKQIELEAGESKTFELVVKPYSIVVREEAVSETIAGSSRATTVTTTTGKAVQEVQKYAVAKPTKVEEVKVQKAVAVAEQVVTEEIEEEIAIAAEEEKPIKISPTVINLYKRYKFNIRAMQKNDPKNQDISYAVLNIKPEEPPQPPPFPGEEVEIKLYKGWNLIRLPGKLIKFEKISLDRKLIGFVYLKEEQRYVTLIEAQKILGKEFGEYLVRNAFWVYSYQEFNLKVNIDREVSYSDIELKKGWNLVPITEDMLGGYLNDLKGDCEFEKLYLWNAKRQVWETTNEQYQFSDELLNYGFLIKVKENCRLGGVVITLTPPAMPE